MIKKIWNIISWYLNPIQSASKKGMKIGTGCSLSSHADIGTEPYLIELGNHVEITSGCRLITHDGGMWPLKFVYGGDFAKDFIHKYGKVIIGDNTYLGVNTIVLPGITIGKNCIIGAGSVVTKDIPDNSVACGVPAKVIKSIDEYAKKCVEQNLDWNHEYYKKNKKEEILRVIK